MKKITSVSVAKPALRFLQYGVVAILLLIPFHALLSVWIASRLGHYDLIRLWKEFLLLLLVGVASWFLIRDKGLRNWFTHSWIVRLSCLFIAVTMLSAVIALVSGSVTPKAVAYGLIVDVRPILFMLVIFALIRSGGQVRWARVLVVPAILVIAFGLAQLILPPDALKHVGYSPDTIKPFQTVDNSADFPRLQSTMRGPNPLGAYLVPIICLLILGLAYLKEKKLYGFAIAAASVVLLGTYSRSALLGAALAVGLLLGWTVQRPAARRLFWIISGVILLVFVISFVSLKRTAIVQNVFFHTSDQSTSATSSNSVRAAALRSGVGDIVREPLGGGVGSAGPASVYNQERQSRLAENYFLQLGQETGIVGMGLFIALLLVIMHKLWQRRRYGIVRAALASLIGIIFINLISHAWADDTLAYITWGLLAACLSKSDAMHDTAENY